MLPGCLIRSCNLYFIFSMGIVGDGLVDGEYLYIVRKQSNTLQWRHNGHDGVSNNKPHDCLLNRLFRRRSKKTSKLRVTGLCAGWPVNSPHKGPVTREMFPFDDVIMKWQLCCCWWYNVSWWRHQMETFSAWLVLCAGNSPVPVNSPHKGQWRGALMFSLICMNGWVNNREAGDLRRYPVHYDVIVMLRKHSDTVVLTNRLSNGWCKCKHFKGGTNSEQYVICTG